MWESQVQGIIPVFLSKDQTTQEDGSGLQHGVSILLRNKNTDSLPGWVSCRKGASDVCTAQWNECHAEIPKTLLHSFTKRMNPSSAPHTFGHNASSTWVSLYKSRLGISQQHRTEGSSHTVRCPRGTQLKKFSLAGETRFCPQNRNWEPLLILV